MPSSAEGMKAGVRLVTFFKTSLAEVGLHAIAVLLTVVAVSAAILMGWITVFIALAALGLAILTAAFGRKQPLCTSTGGR